MARPRPMLVAAAAALIAVAPLASAAPSTKPQLTDPSGDARVLGAAYDIVSAQLTTTGVTATKKLGKKKITTYTPKNLVASLTLAGPPSTQVGSSYTFDADITACGGGYFQYSYTPGAHFGNGNLFVNGCGTSTPGTSGLSEILADVAPVVAGNTITWTMPLSDLGKDLPLSTVFSNLRAYTDLNEPVFGIIGTGALQPDVDSSIDSAKADASWKLG